MKAVGIILVLVSFVAFTFVCFGAFWGATLDQETGLIFYTIGTGLTGGLLIFEASL